MVTASRGCRKRPGCRHFSHPNDAIRPTMIQPRSLRFLHCTVFIVDSYKQRSASLHFTRPGSSQEDIPKALVPAHRGFGIRGRSSSRWVLNGMAEDPQLARKFLEGGHRFAKTSLGYEASEPPRGVAWITLIRTQIKRYVQRLFDSD